MTRNQKILHNIFSCIGILVIAAFGFFWFRTNHIPHNFYGWHRIFDVLLYLLVSYVVWLPLFMKVLVWSISSHIREIKHSTPEKGLKVAFVTTFVPASESITLLEKTLPAMVKAYYEHDTWLLDEGNNPDVKILCRKLGVNHFSRAGVDNYNQTDGKFAKKTKGGNHNSWYDTVGNQYDIVAQIDTDFIPKANFLLRTLGYFRDPKIAFVGTPQIYGNTEQSLIARGAAEQTFTFYGPVLRGMDGMNTTLLIGANHVMRVKALKSVDHYSAHITEDLLTGMKLHAAGWTSIYVPEVLAIGEGPVTWKSYFSQQKRWAYGCMHILFNHSFKLFRKMSFRRKIYYFMIQQHYFTGISMIIAIICLSLYFLTGIQSVTLTLLPFLSFYVPVLMVCGLMSLWLQQFNIRPKKERGILFAGMYIELSAWPIFFLAFWNLFIHKKMVYKVTPKGMKIKKVKISIGLFVPHIIISLFAALDVIIGLREHRDSVIMLFWALLTSLSMIIVPTLPLVTKIVLKLSGIFKKRTYFISRQYRATQ